MYNLSVAVKAAKSHQKLQKTEDDSDNNNNVVVSLNRKQLESALSVVTKKSVSSARVLVQHYLYGFIVLLLSQ